MIVVKEITEFGGACPFQLEGKTDKGESVYARYRWGHLRVEVNNEIVFTKQLGEDQDDEAVLKQYEEGGMSADRIASMRTTFENMRKFSPGEPLSFDGYMDMDKLRAATEGHIQWPEE